jgi:hypothetical protein
VRLDQIIFVSGEVRRHQFQPQAGQQLHDPVTLVLFTFDTDPLEEELADDRVFD